MKSFLLIFLLSAPSLAFAGEKLVSCKATFIGQPDSFFTRQGFCDSKSKKLRRYEFRFRRTNKPAHIFRFDENEHLQSMEIFDIDQKLTAHMDYTWVKDSQYHLLKFYQKNGQKILSQKDLVKIDFQPNFTEATLQSTFYNDDGSIDYIHEYEPKANHNLIRNITLFDQGKVFKRYHLEYFDDLATARYLKKFTLISENPNQMPRDFIASPMIDIPLLIQNQNFDSSEKNRRLEVWKKEREPIVIIDSGFDYTHPDLTYKMAHLHDEIFSSEFQFGWYMDREKKISRPENIDHVLFPAGNGLAYPFSHGTHVASIALAGIEEYALIGFAGNNTDYYYLDKISKFISLHKIKYINMSFGFGGENAMFSPGSNARNGLLRLMEDNQQSLFIIAAGNDTADLDKWENDDWPATAPVKNKLVVAAINTDKIQVSNFPQYELASFSNFGIQNVDIAAPGFLVNGAALANDHVRESGTSMAAPTAMNLVLQIHSADPSLSNEDIRHLLLRTAYVNPNKILPVRCGGIIARERVLVAAHFHRMGESLEKAIQQSHQDISYPGEENYVQRMQFLRELWKSRKL